MKEPQKVTKPIFTRAIPSLVKPQSVVIEAPNIFLLKSEICEGQSLFLIAIFSANDSVTQGDHVKMMIRIKIRKMTNFFMLKLYNGHINYSIISGVTRQQCDGV